MSAVTTTPSKKERWRAPRWLLIISYAVTIVVPLYGQIIGLLIGVVLVILPHRRRHGVLLVVVSILMAVVWLFIVAFGAGGGAVSG